METPTAENKVIGAVAAKPAANLLSSFVVNGLPPRKFSHAGVTYDTRTLTQEQIEKLAADKRFVHINPVQKPEGK